RAWESSRWRSASTPTRCGPRRFARLRGSRWGLPSEWSVRQIRPGMPCDAIRKREGSAMSDRHVRIRPDNFSLREMLRLLEELVCLESPSREKAALDAVGAFLADHLRQAGADVESIANDHGGDHLVARFPGRQPRRPALVLGHFDTVWPLGSLKRLPFRVDE